MTYYNLKFAFLISGMTRNYIYCSQTFKKYILDNCDGDVFVSFKQNSRVHYYADDITNQIPLSHRININDNIEDSVFLNNLFENKLKYFNYDDEDYISLLKNEKIKNLHEKIANDEYVINMIDQYSRVKNIAEKFEDYCIQNNAKYDIVVRVRLDRIWWTRNINLNDYIEDTCKVYLSYISWIKSPYNNLPNWIQDFIFMGNKDTMIYIMKDFFLNIYNSYDFILEHKLNNSPEIQFGNYINSNANLTQKIVQSKINNELCAYFYDFHLYLKGYYISNNKNEINNNLIKEIMKKKENMKREIIKKNNKIEMKIY
jgi:hypothetical protein